MNGTEPSVSQTPNPAVAGTAATNTRSDRLISGVDLIDYSVGGLFPEKVQASTATPQQRDREVIKMSGKKTELDPEFNERLQRNLDTVSKFDMNYALYWIKSDKKDKELNKSLAKLCRQEDILCHNSNGEFVAILTGTDENGLKGFETRIEDRLGKQLADPKVKRGYALYRPGDPTQGSRRESSEHLKLSNRK
ncbi:MAG TPA: hypothetical protein VNM92_02895 [Thermoanaerobaculia bacterium]|nr:hypothetical protein [Thermoanaerobaculia bacterium]